MQEILFAIFFLAIGFVLLIKGADFFVDGSSAVAKLLRVPPIIIGLTVVAMGTSLPELAVSVTAAMSGNNALAVSNVVGSNIFNLMVVCGVCALFCPLTVSRGTLTGEFPFSVIVAVVLMVLGWLGMTLGHIDGFILLLLFVGFLLWMIRSAQKARNESEAEDEYEIRPIWQCIVYIVGGAAAIAAGGQIVVNAASAIATSFGMSQNLIGLTIVAFGTSLPELATSVVAARKHEVDMALGNVIGSNIFNILFVLGVAAAIHPMVFQMENIIDIIVLVVMSIIVLCFAWTKQKLVRWEGFTMLVMYAAYVVYICLR